MQSLLLTFSLKLLFAAFISTTGYWYNFNSIVSPQNKYGSEPRVIDTVVFSTGNDFVAGPGLIYAGRDMKIFFDWTSENMLFYSSNNKLQKIENLSAYIDRIIYPQSVNGFWALNPDSLYCFLYNKLFLIDRHSGKSMELQVNLEFDNITYTPEGSNQSIAVDRKRKKAYIAVNPDLSPTDRDYMDHCKILKIDLTNKSSAFIPVSVPDNYIRGMYYGQLMQPLLSCKNGDLLCFFPIHKGYYSYNEATGKVNHSDLQIDVSEDILPKDLDKSLHGFYYSNSNIIYQIFQQEKELFIVHRQAYNREIKSNRINLENTMYLAGFYLNSQAQLFDIKLDCYADAVLQYIENNRLYFRIWDLESELENNFKMVVYEISF